MITGKNYIGKKLSATGNKTFKTFNPLLNIENSWGITEASASEVNQAAELASEAFKAYSKISGKKKAIFLRTIANEIEALGDDLLQVYSSESGLPNGRAMGERGRTLGQLRAFADHVELGHWVDASIDTAQPDRQPMAKVDLRKMNIALGPVVVFGASNFPLAFSTAG
ncbi:aldehyde dehydrogenase family protein, partial [Algibacter sp.]|uniref:aldehyde dehydrogenase family protein n=1 Tax=Algibacter sp. TaxID=1872428 RepID=UPI003C73C1D0